MSDYDFNVKPIEDDEQIQELKNLAPGHRITIIQLGFYETWEADQDGNKKLVWRLTKEELEQALEKSKHGVFDHPNPEVNALLKTIMEQA